MKKIYFKIIIIVFSAIIVVILVANVIISNFVENKINDLLLKNNSKYYTTTVEKIKFNLLDRSITVSDLILNPTDLSITELKNKDSIKNDLQKISLSSIELNGIHLYNILFNKNIEINELELNEVLIQKIINSKSKKIKSEKKKFNLDSIYIENINGFKINKFDINNISFQIVDVSYNDTIFQHKPLSLELIGFRLNNYAEHYFKIEPLKDNIEINDIKIHFHKKKYTLDIDAINFDFENKIIDIENLRYKPIMSLLALANTYKYNDATFDIDIKNLMIYNYDIHKTLNNEGIFIDSILVSGMKLDLYKDKAKPWNESKIKKLPHVALKQMDLPLYIKKVNLKNSFLDFKSNIAKKNILLELSLNDIDTQITNITSIKEYREEPLNIIFKSKLMDKVLIHVNISFPLKDNHTRFHFNGNLGTTKFKYFDSAIFPTLGLKILKGNLNKLTFNASADNVSARGEMIMLYDGLETKIFKSHSTEKNKVLSWGVNSVVHNSNPGKHKNAKIRIAEMHYLRVNYMGFIGYLWRTLQSGITNTIAPGGKTLGKVEAKKVKKTRNEN